MEVDRQPTGSLLDCFIAGLSMSADRECLRVEDQAYTYAEIAQSVATASAGLADIDDGQDVVAVFTAREAALFVGILTCLALGKGYAPVSPGFPDARAREIIAGSGVRTVLTSPACLAQLLNVLGDEAESYEIVVLCDNGFSNSQVRTIPCFDHGVPVDDFQRPAFTSPLAYLMFTSGSTGAPKGVPITHENALQFVQVMQDRYGLTAGDRVICLPDFYFDLSIFPIWVTWNAGAAIYVPAEKDKMMPIRFAQENQISVWCSVPSAISFLVNFNVLKPGLLPNIRLSVFCGEPLLKSDVTKWLDACPDSKVDNLYGPTEVTVFSTVFPVTRTSVDHGDGDVVSIGKALEGVKVCIVDDNLVPVDPGNIGELCLAGPQVAPGYWRNTELSEAKFRPITLKAADNDNRWYLTGDLVLEAPDGNLVFKGRVDDQVQVSGYRVELGDIEQAVRRVKGVDAAAAVYTKEAAAKSNSIYLFVAGKEVCEVRIANHIKNVLPTYMAPKKIVEIDQMPQNRNGKIDKAALKKIIEDAMIND